MFRIEEIEAYRIIYAFLKSMCIVKIAVFPCSLAKTFNRRYFELDPDTNVRYHTV